MNKYFLTFLLSLCLSLSFGLTAYAYEIVKDTYYFLRDDGKFSEKEKDEEAQYIYQQCSRNIMQSVYFNCECIAGAFRQTRDSDEKIRPQNTILTELFNDDSRGCVNTPAIAGENYRFCSNYASTLRARSKNNEEYCTCVANDVAKLFSEDPRLRTRHIEKLRTNAMVSCNQKFN